MQGLTGLAIAAAEAMPIRKDIYADIDGDRVVSRIRASEQTKNRQDKTIKEFKAAINKLAFEQSAKEFLGRNANRAAAIAIAKKYNMQEWNNRAMKLIESERAGDARIAELESKVMSCTQ